MENRYTFKELLIKYNLSSSGRMQTDQAIRFLKLRGISVELIEIKRSAYYKILDDKIFNLEWKTYPFDKKYEVAKEGFVRKKEDKRLVGGSDGRGYLVVSTKGDTKNYFIHRMVMETYKPIQDMENYVVDHIDGKRDNNNINNLRWLTSRQNSEERDKNFILLNQNYQLLIQKYGYQKLNNIFLNLLEETN
jgi:hypothetical protein